MKLTKHSLAVGSEFQASVSGNAVYVQHGSVHDGSNTLHAGGGFFVGSTPIKILEKSTTLICFEVATKSIFRPQGEQLLMEEFDWEYTDCILRLDQVSFPTGAIAYRHTHAGAGIRFLTQGRLEIQSDHHTEAFKEGDSWFEDVLSPVRATAVAKGTTQFVRAMVLPMEYEGKSTIDYLNSEDDDKPRLQTNHRFFEQRIRL